MENMNDIVNKLVEDLEIPEDIPVMYEVWAIGYDEEYNVVDEAELLLGTFEDPDEAVGFARDTSLEDVVNLAADDQCDMTTEVSTIIIEVEAAVPDEENGTMNIGTVYKKLLDVVEELPEYVSLASDEYELVVETGDIKVPCHLLKDYNKNDLITVLFTEKGEPWPIVYKIISKTTDNYYICEFV